MVDFAWPDPVFRYIKVLFKQLLNKALFKLNGQKYVFQTLEHRFVNADGGKKKIRETEKRFPTVLSEECLL